MRRTHPTAGGTGGAPRAPPGAERSGPPAALGSPEMRPAQNQLRAPRSPQRGRRGGGAQGRTCQHRSSRNQRHRAGDGAQRSGRSTRALKAPGAGRKSAAKPRSAPGAGAKPPPKPRSGRPGGTQRPPRSPNQTRSGARPTKAKRRAAAAEWMGLGGCGGSECRPEPAQAKRGGRREAERKSWGAGPGGGPAIGGTAQRRRARRAGAGPRTGGPGRGGWGPGECAKKVRRGTRGTGAHSICALSKRSARRAAARVGAEAQPMLPGPGAQPTPAAAGGAAAAAAVDDRARWGSGPRRALR